MEIGKGIKSYDFEDVDFLITSTPIKNKLPIPVIEVMTIYNQKATKTPRRNARGRLLFILFLIMLFKLSCFFHLRVNISERQKCQTLIVIQRVLYIPFALEQKIVVLVKILHPFALE